MSARPSAPSATWPTEWEGNPLTRVPLSDREQRFTRGFPGEVARFTDGRRDLIMRRVTAGTRQLHSSADCFRGLGYTVTPQPAVRDAYGAPWSRFHAVRQKYDVTVRERITDEQGHAWSDVSAWYWAVLLRQTEGPWLAVTVVEAGRQ